MVSLLFTNSLLLFLPCGSACAKMAEALAFEVWCVVWSLNATSYIKCKSSTELLLFALIQKRGLQALHNRARRAPSSNPFDANFIFPEWPLGSVPYPLTFTHCSVRTTVKNTRRNPAVIYIWISEFDAHYFAPCMRDFITAPLMVPLPWLKLHAAPRGVYRG